MAINKKLIAAHVAMFVVALIYAANYTIAKPVMAGPAHYLTPFGFIMMRCFVGTSLLWITHALFVRESIDRKDLGRMALCGLCGIAGNQLCFFYGLNLTTPINGALIMLVTPILVLLLSMVVFREKLNLNKAFGIAIGLSGATLLILQNSSTQPDAPNPALGNSFVAINAAFYAAYLVLVKPLMTKYSALTTLKWVFLFGLFYVLPFGLKPMLETDFSRIPAPLWWNIGFVLVFVTYFTYVLNGAALSIVKASVTSTYIYLQPLLASLIAVLAGKDQLTWVLLGAGLLIGSGVYLVSKRPASMPSSTHETTT